MHNTFVRVLGIIAFVASPVVSLAGGSGLPANYPANGSGANSFNWIKEWGSIHMNSFADGLNDPGAPATGTGVMPCPNPLKIGGSGSLCNTVQPTADQYQRVQLTNGIKYDIKNSLVNCMAKAVPNYSLGNNWDSDIETYGPCTNAPSPVSSLSNLNRDTGTKFIHDYTGPETKWRPEQKALAMDPAIRGNIGRKLYTYLPVYDARSNDARAWGTGGPGAFVGCQQQITNNCGVGTNGEIIRDIYQCISSPESGAIAPSPGYLNPVSHVFTPQEVADLGGMGAQLPTIYYAYDSKDGSGNVRKALCASDPSVDATKCSAPMASGATVEKIDTSDPTNSNDHFLSNLKSYRFKTNDGDMNNFVVMDPKDFFDLRLYMTGGTYDAAYEKQPSALPDGTIKANMLDQNGNVQVFNTCPVQGITNGYGGICDPTGKAGCNIPIYGQGNETDFTDSQGNSYTYANFPLKWSGYATSWAVISQAQYLQNICGTSQSCGPSNTDPNDREDYYIVDSEEGLTSNPIFMITRSPDYCEVAEMTSNPRQQLATGAQLSANMPCIQYLQYQKWQDENGVDQWSFVDMYNPVEDEFETIPPESDTAQLFDLKQQPDGSYVPDYGSCVKGTGPNRFVPANVAKNCGAAGNGFVRLLDTVDPEGTGGAYVDASGASAVVAKYKDKTGGNSNAVSQNKTVVLNSAGAKTMGQYLLCNDGTPFDPATCVGKLPDGTAKQADTSKGTALYLTPGTATAMRMPQKVSILVTDAQGKKTQKDTSCVVVAFVPPDPTVKREIFVPTNSQEEFQSFVWAMNGPNPPVEGAQLFDCGSNFQGKGETKVQLAHEGQNDPNNFTDTWKDYTDPLHPVPKATFKTWAGTLQCPDVAQRPACNQVRMISAQRRCQLENGALGSCDECAAQMKLPATDPMHITDPDAVAATKFDFSDSLVGGAVDSSPMEQHSNLCYFSATCFAQSSDGCPPAGVPGGHVFCLSPDTKIDMANGGQKAIKDIKAGDEVVSFNAKGVRSSAMSRAKVKATAITKNQEIVQINDLKITPLHKVVLSTGRAVMAKEVKVGDKLLKGNGQVEVVTKVKSKNKKITVYNLVLDKENDGYVAGGVRVMSYPLMPEMEVIEGHAKAKSPGSGATRAVSSLKHAK